jgi:hypothetical protein
MSFRYAPILLGLILIPCAALADESSNPGALPGAKQVLAFMSQLAARYDRRVISGQSIGRGEEAERLFAEQVEPLQKETSRRVALLDAVYGNPGDPSTGPLAGDSSLPNRILIDHWKSGGLVQVSFFPRNPWTGGNARDTGVRKLEEMVTAGTASNTAWIKQLDDVARPLAELRDAGVVVLWRPLSDMNAGSFWWGKREDEEFHREGFVRLWRQMFDYLTGPKKLNNLLWVYSASSDAHKKTSASAFFPGKEYCDIVGLDSSSSDVIWDGYNEMAQLGKPFGATNIGPSPGEEGTLECERIAARIRFWYPLTTFFVAGSGGSALVRNRNATVLMKDPWVLSRDEVDRGSGGIRRWKREEKLAIKSVEVLTRDPACWKRVDIRIDLAASFETPFDPAQIEIDGTFLTPSGKTVKVPAFFDQPFERQVWGGGRSSEEMMFESGPGEWRLRFMPSESGEYCLAIRARDRSGSVDSAPVTFRTSPGEGKGYIRISGKDPHYFEFDDGSPFFAIGLNMVEHPLSEYFRYIPRLAQNGGNFSRLWIGFDYFALEYGAMGDYRLANAWRLDQIMQLSEQFGIYQKLCIDWIRHITPRGEPRRNFDQEEYAYSVSNGGPCRNMRDFFTLPEARRLFKNRLRYIVARWGYSPNVMAWELWNEIDMVDPKAAEAAVIVPWNQEMCRYLKSIDPWHHLTTNSLAGRDRWKALWPMPENEFAQRHSYSTPRPDAVLASADMAGNVLGWLDDVSDFGKPYLMAEFGLQRDRMEVRALCDRDQDGVHMHNGIWAALAHGSAGTAQLWWWGQYVDPKNLYYHFRAVAEFIKGIAWTTSGFVRAEIGETGDNLRALGLRGNPVSIVWMQNKSHTWWNVIQNNPIPPVEAGELSLASFPPGRYRVEYWNTTEGRMIGTAVASAAGETLKIPFPRIETDIAIKIMPDAK